MATYYKYAERDVNSQIDWGKIGQDVTNMLKEQARLKAEKEQAFDKQTTELGQFIDDVPQGDWRSLNQKYQDATQDFQEYRLQQDRLYKAGLLDPRQYKMNRQRNLDDVTVFYDIGKTAQASYKEATERLQAGTSSFTEQDVLLSVEGLGNMQNIKPIINPATGGLQIARMKKGEDGVEVVDTKNTMSIHEMNNYLKFKQDKFKKDEFIAAKTNLLGNLTTSDMIEAYNQGGVNYVLETTNKALREDIDKIFAAASAEIKANPFNAASILGDWTGEEYELTDSETEAESNPNKIYKYFDENGTMRVKLTAAQEEKVDEYIKQQMIQSFESKVLIPRNNNKPYAPQDSAAIITNRSNKEAQESMFALIHQAAGGDATAGQSLISQQRAQGFGFGTEGGVNFINITDAKGSVVPVRVEGTQLDVGKGIASAFGFDPEEYLKWAKDNNVEVGNVDYTTLQNNLSGITGVRAATPTELSVTFNTTPNIQRLTDATKFVIDAEENKITLSDPIQKAINFKSTLQQIAGPYNIPVDVLNNGNVIIGNTTIINGINKAPEVLKELQTQYDAGGVPDDAGGVPVRLTIAQIRAQNPGLSDAEVIAIFNAQGNN